MIYKLDCNSVEFPQKLKEFVPDLKEIYYRGNLKLIDEKSVAVVGSRNCTDYGRLVARRIGGRMAENGITVVSGLAKGIDTESHIGSLEASGDTVAVLGCGLDVFYPASNKHLQQEIGEKGLLISEYPPGFRAKPYTFPMRNRIISGISDSVVIVEASRRSGSLITAESAVELGKRVYAVPGNIFSNYSFGTNMLIRESVTPLVIIDDLLLDMGINPITSDEGILKMGEEERKIYNVVKKSGEVTIDEIYHITNIKPQEISGIVTILEMKGAIVSSMGKIFVAKF